MTRLPVIQEPRGIRSSRASKWRAGVLVAVHVAIGLHITHWLVTGRTMTPLEPSEAMAWTKSGIVNAGLIFFAATVLLTAIFGRFVCGWACHLVALQDLSRWLLQKVGIRPRPLNSKLLRWVPALAFGYMFLWPLAYRWWVGDSFARHGADLVTGRFWDTFPGWTVGILTFFVCGGLIIYLLGAKGFCTYACPYGAAYGVAEKLAPFRIRVTDACRGCGHCTAVCTSNVRVHEEVRDYKRVVDSGCMKCLDCVSVCPNDALYYGVGPIPLLAAKGARPGRWRRSIPGWEEIVLGVSFAAAFFTFRGLYGSVPFLMSLGLAAVLAYLVLIAARLGARSDLALRRTVLRQGGKLRPAGWIFLAAMAVGTGLWIHSAVVQYHATLGERGWEKTSRLRYRLLDVTGEAPTTDARERVAARRAISHLETARDLGFRPWAGSAAMRAGLELVAGRPQALRAAAHEAIERDELRAHMYHLLAHDAWAAGDAEEAAHLYQASIVEEPMLVDTHVSLGVVLAGEGRLDVATEAFRVGLRYFPDSAQLSYSLGLAEALQGRPEAATAAFLRALELAPEHLPARENLAGVLASVGRYDEAVPHYREAVRLAPDDAGTRVLLARTLAAAGRFEEAKEEAEEAVRLEPRSDDARALLAALRQAIGDGSADPD